jgi:hypothetical protein
MLPAFHPTRPKGPRTLLRMRRKLVLPTELLASGGRTANRAPVPQMAIAATATALPRVKRATSRGASAGAHGFRPASRMASRSVPAQESVPGGATGAAPSASFRPLRAAPVGAQATSSLNVAVATARAVAPRAAARTAVDSPARPADARPVAAATAIAPRATTVRAPPGVWPARRTVRGARAGASARAGSALIRSAATSPASEHVGQAARPAPAWSLGTTWTSTVATQTSSVQWMGSASPPWC